MLRHISRVCQAARSDAVPGRAGNARSPRCEKRPAVSELSVLLEAGGAGERRRRAAPSVVELASRARELAQTQGDRSAEAGPLHLHAAGVRLTGDYEGARLLYLESLELNTELGNDAWQAMELHNLGWVELHRGDLDAAAERFKAREVPRTTRTAPPGWS